MCILVRSEVSCTVHSVCAYFDKCKCCLFVKRKDWQRSVWCCIDGESQVNQHCRPAALPQAFTAFWEAQISVRGGYFHMRLKTQKL